MAGIEDEGRSVRLQYSVDARRLESSQQVRFDGDVEDVDAHRSTTAIRQWLSGTTAMWERRRARVSAMAFLSETEARE